MPVVTLLVAGVLGLMLIALAWPIVMLRRGRKVGLGDGGDALLQRRIRVHSNFVEYVPFAMLVLALLEISGLDRTWVAALGGLLLIGRLLHVIGLSRSSGYSFGRFWGTFLTWSMIIAASVLAILRSVAMLTIH
ncbi:MAPEG family protein [Lysobacter sp. TY2-98]|uniref:MAPEG family protein n=1 Tax=Lysobacter sp. TY2-98 TaxID=2290922 RepID=UPI000E200093|nr:MAPEG family protein [Lysobacter sp. TY2-98]AXK71521.1 MAPEG family protein [Lysobacter sp. TY2-98]